MRNRPATFGRWLALGCLLWNSGCEMDDADEPRPVASRSADRRRIEPGIHPDDSGWAHLPFTIRAVHTDRQLSEQPPGHAADGEWTVMECLTPLPDRRRFWVAVKESKAGEAGIAWGKAVLWTGSPQQGAEFLTTFGEAFHQPPPPAREGAPAGRIEMSTAVLGTGLGRDPEGGFSEQPRGDWTATKWFLSSDDVEAEVFFNYSLAERSGEFSEKDTDYREDLLLQLAIALRDGPLPERTPENDPSLTVDGPQFADWRDLASDAHFSAFASDGSGLCFSAIAKAEAKTPVFWLPLPETGGPGESVEIARLEGARTKIVAIPGPVPRFVVVAETAPDSAPGDAEPDEYFDQRSSLWVVSTEPGEPRRLEGTWNDLQISLPQRAVSPDGRYLAVFEWQRGAQPSANSSVLHLVDLESGSSSIVQIPGTRVWMADWKPGPSLLAIIEKGNHWEQNGQRTFAQATPATGAIMELSPDDELFPWGQAISPDRRRVVHVIEKRGLSIEDLATGQSREFLFHERDRRSAFEGSVEWIDNDYLLFEGPRPALIDVATLKMNFPLPKDAPMYGLIVDPRGRWLVGVEDSKLRLGRVVRSAAK